MKRPSEMWRRFVRRQAFGNQRVALFMVASWTTFGLIALALLQAVALFLWRLL